MDSTNWYDKKIEEKPENLVDTLVESIPINERINIILQSFIISSGNSRAHSFYVMFLAIKFNLSFNDAHNFLRKCLSSLNVESLEEIRLAAYKIHGGIIANVVKKQKLREKDVLSNKELAIKAIGNQLPTLPKGNSDVTPKVFVEDSDSLERMKNLATDFTSPINSMVDQLKEIAKKLGYYNNSL